jgi:hypothetical protein
MASIPVKPEYGPTLGRLLAPRWHAAPALVRRAVIAAGVGLVALAVGLVLTLEPARYSHGGSLPFSFSYKGLYRTAPDPGGYVKLTTADHDRGLRYSYAVAPLSLPPYSGGVSGELPVYASGYGERLAARYPAFTPRGEGKTRVNKVPAYQVLFTATIEGHEMYGRAVMLLPERPGARQGVSIVMLSRPSKSEDSPSEVASEGVLLRPLKTFAFG